MDDPLARNKPGRPRIWFNRAVAAVVVPAALVHVALAARLRPRSARRVASRWVSVVARITGVRFAVADRPEPTPEGLQVIVANHSSPLDIAAILTAMPATTFVAGRDLFRIPLLAGAMRALGTIPVDRRSQNRAQLVLPPGLPHRGQSITVFPEGRIVPTGRRLPFRRSAFTLAIGHQAPIVPVAIHGAARALPPRSWLGVRPGTVTVQFLEPIPTVGLTGSDRHRVTYQAEQRILAALGAEDGGTAEALTPDRSHPPGW